MARVLQLVQCQVQQRWLAAATKDPLGDVTFWHQVILQLANLIWKRVFTPEHPFKLSGTMQHTVSLTGLAFAVQRGGGPNKGGLTDLLRWHIWPMPHSNCLKSVLTIAYMMCDWRPSNLLRENWKHHHLMKDPWLSSETDGRGCCPIQTMRKCWTLVSHFTCVHWHNGWGCTRIRMPNG